MNDTKQALEAVVGQIEHRPSGAYSYPSGLGAEAVSVIARHGPALIAALEDARRLDALERGAFTMYRTRDPAEGLLCDHVTIVNEDAPGSRRGILRATVRAAIDAMAAGGDQPEPPQ